VLSTQPGLTQPGLTQSELPMPMSYPHAGVRRRDYSPECSLQARSPSTRKPYYLGIYQYHLSSSILNTGAFLPSGLEVAQLALGIAVGLFRPFP